MQNLKKESELDDLTRNIVRTYGVINVIRSVVSACDLSGDFAHSCNDKRLEEYWRRTAVAILDSIKRIEDTPEKSKKY